MLCYVPCPRSTCPEIRVRSRLCVSVSFFCFFKFSDQSTPWNSRWHFKATAPALWPPQRFEWFRQQFYFFNCLFCFLVRKCDSFVENLFFKKKSTENLKILHLRVRFHDLTKTYFELTPFSKFYTEQENQLRFKELQFLKKFHRIRCVKGPEIKVFVPLRAIFGRSTWKTPPTHSFNGF